MNKGKFIKMVQNYVDYAMRIDVALPTVNNGCWGTAYEGLIKIALNNCRGVYIKTGAGRADTLKRDSEGNWKKIEIKTSAGELLTLAENEMEKTADLPWLYDNTDCIVSSVFDADYIVYAPLYKPEKTIEESTYILTAEGFLSALTEANMIRLKKSTAMYSREKQGLPWWYDKVTIQTFSNSYKKEQSFIEALEENQLCSLSEFIAMWNK